MKMNTDSPYKISEDYTNFSGKEFEPNFENFKIFEKIKEECVAIERILNKYKVLANTSNNAYGLLDETKAYVDSIKKRVGSGNELYLKVSTAVVQSALEKVVAEVNKAQKEYTYNFTKLQGVLRGASRVMMMMDRFDMEPNFASNNYMQNRALLADICEQAGLEGGLSSVSANSYVGAISEHKPMRPEKSKSGCVVLVIIAFIILAIMMCQSGDNTNDYHVPTTGSNPSYNKEDKQGISMSEYANNSLETGEVPYTELNYRKGHHSAITVNTSSVSGGDLVVLIKSNSEIVRNAYIKGGDSYTFELPNGLYQVFFYSGAGWNPDKKMPRGIRGGFVSEENVMKDDPFLLEYQGMVYTLELRRDGNFSAQQSSVSEVF